MQVGSAVTSHPINLKVARVCALLVIAGGTMSALGWIFDIPRLIDWDNSGISIKFNPSICLVLIGGGLLFVSYYPRFVSVVRILGTVCFLIAGATLLQTILGVSFGIDTLVVDEPPGARATLAPGRMGVPASTSFMLLGLELILATFARSRRLAAILSIASLCITALSLTGYVFGADQLYTVPRLTGIALQTAIMLAALSVGIAAAIPEYGITAAILRKDAGGLMLRRALPLILIFLFGISWLLLQGNVLGYYDLAFKVAIRTVLEMLILTGVLWWTAARIAETQKLTTDTLNAKAEIETQRRIGEAQELERKRLSRDLHDQVGQEITGLRLALVKIRDESNASPELIEAMRTLREKVEKLDAEVSNLAWRMRPPILDSDGILVGLRRLGEECSAIHSIDFDLQATDRLPPLPPDVETNIYRIVQESMNNVVKHADATGIGVTLDYANGEVRLAVEDDGKGFVDDVESIHTTDTGKLGLLGIRERAAIVGGTLDIETAPGVGTTVLVRIPLDKKS